MIERIGISLERSLLEQFDALIGRQGYVNRSEAVRDLIRERLVEAAWSEGRDAEQVAVVTLVYDHHASGLPQRLAQAQHDHHGAVVSALHVHMDADTCLEVLVLRGPARVVARLADGLTSTRGVTYGRVVPAPTGETLR
jgi:CopG family nickel-responsive transcriptional regulator